MNATTLRSIAASAAIAIATASARTVIQPLSTTEAMAICEEKSAFRRPSAMDTMRSGEVKPGGWLRDWCITARNGYISRMDEVDIAFRRAWNSDFHPRGQYLDWKDPNDPTSAFTASIEIGADGKPVVTWTPDLVGERSYKVFGRKTLDPKEEWIDVTEKVDPNTGEKDNGASEGFRFFKATVEMP